MSDYCTDECCAYVPANMPNTARNGTSRGLTAVSGIPGGSVPLDSVTGPLSAPPYLYDPDPAATEYA